jgi:hypothetical protein
MNKFIILPIISKQTDKMTHITLINPKQIYKFLFSQLFAKVSTVNLSVMANSIHSISK